MKKGIFGAVLGILCIGLASAASEFGYFVATIFEGLSKVIQAVWDILTPVLGAFFGTYEDSTSLFVKLLLAILIFVIISQFIARVNLFAGKKLFVYVISAVFSVIVIRFAGELSVIQEVVSLRNPLVFGAATIGPFLLAFYLVFNSDMNGLARRFVFFLVGLSYTLIWFNYLGEDWAAVRSGGIGGFFSLPMNWVFMSAIILVFAVLLFDNQIKLWFRMHRAGLWRKKSIDREIVKLNDELKTAYEQAGTPAADRAIIDLKQQIKNLVERRASI
jgi:hypothetical protein